jgi:hypothetical protein
VITESDLEDRAIDHLLGGLLADLVDHRVLGLLEVGYLVVERQVLNLQDRSYPIYSATKMRTKHRTQTAYEVNAGLVE